MSTAAAPAVRGPGQRQAGRGPARAAAEQAMAGRTALADASSPAPQAAPGALARAVQAGDAVCQRVVPGGAQLQELAMLLHKDEVIDEAALPGRARGRCALAAAGRAVFDAAVIAAAADAHEGDVQWF